MKNAARLRLDIEESERDHTSLMSARRHAQTKRNELVISGADDAEIDTADAEIIRVDRCIERATAVAEFARAALPVALEAEVATRLDDLAEEAKLVADEYRRIVLYEYLPAARAVAESLHRLQAQAAAVDSINASLPLDRRIRTEAFRFVSPSSRHLPTLADSTVLPPIHNDDDAIWDAKEQAWRATLEREAAQRDAADRRAISLSPIAQRPSEPRPISARYAGTESVGIRIQRPDEAAWFGEREERLAAEEAAQQPNLSDQSKRTGGAR
ncbi:hypothetical protein [Lichenifustis flavocetrariae]|uniref:Uncharacterized protein n=1 Tax=Lichenifustis flavocetrariae TaxID=2949735 RepID=A0AA42CJP4_9HYPH|nr:hypothetical protein [Lichenifustis flavocetrariae]MCW6509694.1 hypothetical protein [Lichenifustis flavocetrariae]